jgi:signal transduction histidine kinase
VTVNIELRQHAGWHSVDVVDSGSGIPASLLPFVFDRFRRGDVVRTTSGAGLGLSIVAAIVGVHGGGVTARSSAPHGGTTISLQFPAVDIADESAGTAVPADSVVDGN